ncbi:MAG: mandelate racemase/muconate lactonizing enzyme family protein [Acidobacteriota bacterium]
MANSRFHSRRSFLGKTVGAGAAACAASFMATADDYEAIAGNVRTASQPSDLKITDLRVCRVHGHWVVRLDTNQGLHGYGEVRDGASPTYALMLKSRIKGLNPCHVDKVFRRIKQFGGHARQAGGVVSIEMACWDLAGKAWNVPCWQMLGGQFRDKIRLYADTTFTKDPIEQARRLKGRIDQGFTFLKMDTPITLLQGIEGALTWPKGQGVNPFQQYGDQNWEWTYKPHPFTGIRVTEKGLAIFEEYALKIRETLGWEIPIATDHYGHFGIEDGIKLARRLDKCNFAWYEDMVPWMYVDQYIQLKNSCTTPILTGEDIYLLDGFRELIDRKAVSIIHPDLATSGGLLETKKIGDYAMEHGVAMAMHMAGGPVTMFAGIHCAAATENFLVMEHHGVDDPGYEAIAEGPAKPFMGKDGFVPVPNLPGLGIELNEDAIKRELKDPVKEYFPPTPEWDYERSHDRLWSLKLKTGSEERT